MSITCCRTKSRLGIYKQSGLQVITEFRNVSVLNIALKFRSQSNSLKHSTFIVFHHPSASCKTATENTMLKKHCCNSPLKREKVLEMSIQSPSNTLPVIIKYRLYFHSHVLYKMTVPLLYSKGENYNALKNHISASASNRMKAAIWE